MCFRILLTLLCLSLAVPCMAQRKQIGDARTILKSGKNPEQAEKLMTDLLKDSANRENTRIYQLWFQSVVKQYEAVNEKMYMKQAVDTAKFFGLARRMFAVAEQLDSLEMQPDKKGKVNLQYRNQNAQLLDTYRPNLFFGGTYHLRKGQFMPAFEFFEAYLDCARQPLFLNYNYEETDDRMGEAAYWATYCAYRMGDPVLTLRHEAEARRDPAKFEFTLQYIAESWKQLGDDSMYVATLREGFREYPTSDYFFPRLMDSYTKRGNLEQALAVVDEALEVDSLSELFLFAKSTVLLNMGRYEESLEYSLRLIALNEDAADAQYNAGTAYLNLALAMDARKNRKQVRKLYQQAMPHMEAYRRLAPAEKGKWGPALYRIYFNLNMGKQFEEIDQILKK